MVFPLSLMSAFIPAPRVSPQTEFISFSPLSHGLQFGFLLCTLQSALNPSFMCLPCQIYFSEDKHYAFFIVDFSQWGFKAQYTE